LVSFGAGRSTSDRRMSARRTVTGSPRRTVAPTTVSAPPGLTTEHLYNFTTGDPREFLTELQYVSSDPAKPGRIQEWKSDCHLAVRSRSSGWEREGREHGLVAG